MTSSFLSVLGNTIYNILPDAISGLSTSKEVSPDSFKNIMKYLFSFIEKDKQVDSLVEKLCHRFPTSTGNVEHHFLKTEKWKEKISKRRNLTLLLDPKHWRDIAYCLTLLNYSEKSFKKLSDLFKFYKDAIADETVYESLLAIAAKVIISQKNFYLISFIPNILVPLFSNMFSLFNFKRQENLRNKNLK